VSLAERLWNVLPSRLRDGLADRRAWRYLAAAEQLPPLAVASEDLAAEVHMMLSGYHIIRALVALRTFYHHTALAETVGAMIHCDGTVSSAQKDYLLEQFPGVQFVDYPSSDNRLTRVLAPRPCCLRNYRLGISRQPKLLHPSVFARADKIILLDSDVAFYARPQRIMEWVSGVDPSPAYLVNWDQEASIPSSLPEIFATSFGSLTSHRGPFQIRHYCFDTGLLLYSRRRLSLDIVEDYYRWQASSPARKAPQMHWFHDEMLERTAYMLNFAAWEDARPFGREYVVGSAPADVCNHFTNGGYYKEKSLLRMYEAVHEITAASKQGGSGPHA